MRRTNAPIIGQYPCLRPGTATYFGCIGMSTCRALHVVPRCLLDRPRHRDYEKLAAANETIPLLRTSH